MNRSERAIAGITRAVHQSNAMQEAFAALSEATRQATRGIKDFGRAYRAAMKSIGRELPKRFERDRRRHRGHFARCGF